MSPLCRQQVRIFETKELPRRVMGPLEILTNVRKRFANEEEVGRTD